MNSDVIMTTTIALFVVVLNLRFLSCLLLRGHPQIPSLITAVCSRSQIRLRE